MQFDWHYQDSQPRKLRSALKMQGVTSSLIKVAIYHGGQMLVNGQPKWAIDLVRPGDTFSLVLPPEPPTPKVDVSNAPIQIAYEDRDFLILNKPAGVASVPAHHVAVADSLVNRVKGYYIRQHYENQVTHVATRLDKNTSGLTIFPKHRFAHAVMDRALKKHLVKKEYLALVSGRVTVSHGYVDAPLSRDPDSFIKRQVNKAGKGAVTEYWTLASSEQASLVRIRLHTGRTHQIRVHFAWLGHPLVGDAMYSGPLNLMDRQALHCYYVSFWDPFIKHQLTVKAPCPDDIRTATEKSLGADVLSLLPTS